MSEEAVELSVNSLRDTNGDTVDDSEESHLTDVNGADSEDALAAIHDSAADSELDVFVDGSGQRVSDARRRSVRLCILLGGLLIVIICIIALNASSGDADGSMTQPDRLNEILGMPDKDRLRQYLKTYTSISSLAGTTGDRTLVDYTSARFTEYKLPNVQEYAYDVLLSYPKRRSLRMLHPTEFTATLKEQPYPEDPTSGQSDVVDTFNGYSASGNVTADVVYVNYGRWEDYLLLKEQGVSLQGKVAIARYGRIFRGLKAMIGELYGISALLIYSDPHDDGYDRGKTYPQGSFRPSSGVQRGSAQYISLYSGDPLTPGQAAMPGLASSQKKYTQETSPTLPKIPIQPISWADAYPILYAMKGTNLNTSSLFKGWQGGLPFEYHLGDVSAPGDVVTVNVDLDMEFSVKRIWDICASIPADPDSPDKDSYVVIGNHRDAWVFGAVDPHSGSAVLLEVARALGHIYSHGWRPRRGIKLCSWDAEEYGLVGSVEWVEQHRTDLSGKAVAYINVDVGVEGPLFHASSSPTLFEYIRRGTKAVKVGQTTVYDIWRQELGVTVPTPGPLGSGSDYTPFFQYLGVSSCDIRHEGHIYGVYHSVYDSYTWMEKFGDPTWEYHVRMAQVWLGVVYHMANDIVLDFSWNEYGVKMGEYLSTLEQRTYIDALSDPRNQPPLSNQSTAINASLSALNVAVGKFQTAATGLRQRIQQLQTLVNSQATLTPDLKNQAYLLNEIAFLGERQMLMDIKLPHRTELWYRHAVYAPSLYGGYSASILPGATESLGAGDWDNAVLQINGVTTALTNAAAFLSAIPQV